MVDERKLEEQYGKLKIELKKAVDYLDQADQSMNELLNIDPENYPAGLDSELIQMRGSINRWIDVVETYQAYHRLRRKLADTLGVKFKVEDDEEFYW